LAASPEQAFDGHSKVYFLELMQMNELVNSSRPYKPSTVNAAPVPRVQNVWSASLNSLSEPVDQDWQYIRMSGFESRQALNIWLDNIENKTHASLQRRYYRQYVALVVEAF